ncbi:unnamed protein product [Adineta ricciae]|uniref:Uncharacterized protein n=1 Tax=Adineta ricciae TaxID=249248 RepID=A0A816F148_ADIRI|nr:unnamed protein product [Adineta ricciae]
MHETCISTLILTTILYACDVVHGTHFRGSMLSWRVLNESAASVTLEILQRHAWRYDYYSPLCTSATIPNGQPILGTSAYSINCISTCPTGLTTLGSVNVPCTGYNIAEQYAMGEGRFKKSIPKNVSFVASFTNTNWFNLVTGNNLAWSVAVRVQTFKRLDTGYYNNAPVITMLPIYRLRNHISYSIKINVADNDFDPYICLWSKGYDQCGNLNNSVPNGVIDNYACYLNFTPQIAGFYAAAVTVEDFIVTPVNISSTEYLSQVPIQFVFHVYDSSQPCVTGPVYIGDLVPDMCIYISIGVTQITRVRFKVQCANATVASYISVNPAGLLTTPIQQDPFDPTIFAFLANFTSSANQIGQNLFCFGAIDSIGNQGASACLRFTVLSATSSLQSMYKQNATRYPMGTVPKTTSVWTLLTDGHSYERPTTESYIRFKRASDDTDFYVLNVVTATDNVFYLPSSLVINSTVVWTPGERFYIYFDPGVFVEASTCLKESMPINDPNFWPFEIPYETTSTTTTSTSTTSATSTSTTRTVPTQRTLAPTTTTTSVTTSTTTTFTTTESVTTPLKTIQQPVRFPTSAIVGITLASFTICFCLAWMIHSFLRIALIRFLLLHWVLHEQSLSICSLSSSQTPTFDLTFDQLNSNSMPSKLQYKFKTRRHQQRNSRNYSIFTNETATQDNLVQITV